jgi:hypothetical protein
MSKGGDDVFVRLREYGLIVCKSCRYSVWPAEVDSHLAGPHHRMAKKDRQRIREEIQSWQGLATSDEMLELPDQLEEAIPELALHDGMMYNINPNICQNVYQKDGALRKHWQDIHQ